VWRYRATGGFDARLPRPGWNANLAITYDQSDMTVTRAYQRFSTIATGLQARVVDDTVIGHLGTGGDRFYNPFSTSQHTCTNRQCGPVETPSSSPAFNTQAVADQITFNNRISLRDELLVADLLVTGDAFGLPAGPAAVALGLHGRRLESKTNFSAFQNDCDAWGEGCQPDTHDLNKYWAAFFELSLPLLDDDQWGEIEAQLAGRYSEHTTSGTDSFNPKIAVRYAPRPFLALRTSYSTAFVAPVDEPREEINLQRSFSDTTCNISSACPTRPTIGIQTIRDPASLEPEQSTSWNVGFSVTLLDDALVMEADYIDIDFDNRFTSPSANDILSLDGQRFERFFEENIASSTPAEVRDAWIDPDNKATGSFESLDIVRDPSGLIRQVFTPRVFNAARMRFKALDLRLTARVNSLRLPGTRADLGILDLSLMATYVDEYSYQLLPTSEKMEGAGARNWATGVVPPIPEWRGRAKLSWFRHPHSALLSANFTGKVIDDSPFANLPGQFPGVSTTIDALLTWDVQYTFSADQLIGSGVTTMTIGALNLFNQVSDPTLAFGGLETLLHDPRGRMFYARISHAF
ncbi:MAG: TonB-dependent receptor, partial [Gammaproteobacteria bacterium]